MADATSTLQILLTLNDQATAALSDSAEKSAAALKQLGDEATSVGVPLAAIGASMTAISGYAVAQAADVQEAGTQLETTFQNQITNANNAASAHSGLATEISFVTDKIQNLEAENTKLSQTHEKTAADAAKVSAQINVNTDSINKYNQQLAGLQGQLGLTGANAAALVTQFDAVAAANTNLGFSQQDSISSLNQLERVIGNPTEALQAYQTAMDLARARGEDLTTSTTQVIQGFNGMGKSLQLIGVNVKDGLAGMQAISAISDQVGGSAAASLDDFNVQVEVMHANIQLAAKTLGEALLPMLTKFAEYASKVVDAIIKWTQAHPELAKAIAIVFTALGLLLALVGTLLVAFGAIATSVSALAVAFGVTALAVVTAVGVIVAIVVALAVIVTLIIAYHTQIWNFMKKAWDDAVNLLKETWDTVSADITKAWNAIKAFFDTIWKGIEDATIIFLDFEVGLVIDFLNTVDKNWREQWQSVSDFLSKIWKDIQGAFQTAVKDFENIFTPWINGIEKDWETTWQKVSDFFLGIWDGIKSGLNTAVTFVKQEVQDLENFINGVIGAVTGPLTAVGNTVSSIIGGLTKAASSVVATGAAATGVSVHDAIIAPNGNVINTDPMDYLIATKTPGSLLGGSHSNSNSQIIVNINGGTYLNPSSVKQMTDIIVRSINQQVKLRST